MGSVITTRVRGYLSSKIFRKPLKIAICLSGYFRLYREIYLNFHKNLYLPCARQGQTDIFISSWDELNSANSFSHKQGELPSDFGVFDREDILAKFPAKEARFESFDAKKATFHIHTYDPSVDLATLHPNIHQDGVLFGLSMLYKRFDCNEMKRREEARTGQPYDMVIQMRPDVFFLREFEPLKVDGGKLSSRTICNDHLFVSSSVNMDRVSSAYTEAGRIANQYRTQKPYWFEPYCPEYFLEHWFRELGFDESRRVELGEDFMHLYPRQNFLPIIYLILKNAGRLSEMQSVLSYPLVSLEG